VLVFLITVIKRFFSYVHSSSPQVGNAVAPRAKATPHNPQARSGIQFELNPSRLIDTVITSQLSKPAVEKINAESPDILSKWVPLYGLKALMTDAVFPKMATFLEGFCADKSSGLLEQIGLFQKAELLVDSLGFPLKVQVHGDSNNLIQEATEKYHYNFSRVKINKPAVKAAMDIYDKQVQKLLQDTPALNQSEPIVFTTSAQLVNKYLQKPSDTRSNEMLRQAVINAGNAQYAKERILAHSPELAVFPFMNTQA
jgi:hypothetical protein